MKNGLTSISGRGAVFVVVAVAVAAYLNTLWNGFVYDDHLQIVKNWWIQDFANLPRFFTESSWQFVDGTQSNYYRPMMHVFHSIVYHIFGLKPWGHHLVNVIFFAVNSVAVLLIMREAAASQAASSEDGGRANGIALVGAMFFALHPVHTEITAWVSAMAELEASGFGLFALYFYIRSNGAVGRQYAVSVALFFLAVLTKETAFAYLPLIVIYDFCMGKGLSLRRYAAYAAAAAVYFALRMNAMGSVVPLAHRGELSVYEFAINVFPLFAAYIRKLVLPMDLNAFYVFRPVHSILEWRAAASLIFTVAYLFAAFRAKGAWRFSLLWTGAALIPVFYIPGLATNVFAERYLYLSSAGFSLFLALCFSEALRRRPFGNKTAVMLIAAAAIIAAAYFAATVKRNAVWRSDLSLWSDTVKKSPDASIPRNNLGLEYYKAKMTVEAEREFIEAIRISSEYDDAHYNLAALYFDAGRLEEAVSELKEAVRISPDYAKAHYNLGYAYVRLGRGVEAIEAFKTAVRLRPGHVESRYNLGYAYLNMGRADMAAPELEVAVKMNPADAGAHYNLGKAYEALGRREDARRELLEAKRLEKQGQK